MAVDARTKAPLEAVEAFVAHLRRHPEDATGGGDKLAERFGLPPDFVHETLANTRRPEPEESFWRINVSLEHLRAWYERSEALFDAVTRRTATFVVGSTIIVTLVYVVFLIATAQFGAGLTGDHGLLFRGFGATLFLIAFSTHMLLFARKSMARYPLIGASTIWILFTVLFLAAAVARREFPSSASDMGSLLVLPALAGAIAVAYGALGLGASILGGYTRLKIEEFREERMTRQELLERYFELESRLRKGRAVRGGPSRWGRLAPVRWVAIRPGAAALALGAIWTSATILFERATGGRVEDDLAITTAEAIKVIGGSLFQLVTGLSLIAVGYASRSVRKSLLSSTLFGLGSIFAMVALRDPLMTTAPWTYRVGTGFSAFLSAITFGALGGFGFRVQERALQRARLRRNDQALIVAEMLRIQWRLEDQSHVPCVMSIDAARSALMKADADPLAVEFSFREYQEWIEEIAREFGGAVHARAGDGAILSFPTCPAGYAAARRIQTDIGRFNAQISRLTAPFRVRIGLHTGRVTGELDEVEYADVIDIAVHVQAVAPVGGIAATEAVVQKTPEEAFVPLAKEIDGRRVFVSLNPTED